MLVFLAGFKSKISRVRLLANQDLPSGETGFANGIVTEFVVFDGEIIPEMHSVLSVLTRGPKTLGPGWIVVTMMTTMEAETARTTPQLQVQSE